MSAQPVQAMTPDEEITAAMALARIPDIPKNRRAMKRMQAPATKLQEIRVQLPTGRWIEPGRNVYLQRAPGCAKKWYVYTGVEDGACVLQPKHNTNGGTRWVPVEKIAGVEPKRRLG